MSSAKVAHLTDRGVVTIGGPDAVEFLQNLVTNDVSHLTEGRAVHAGLLSPQGKILFEFFVVRSEEGFLLDVTRERAADLVKRLLLYKLRAKVEIADTSDRWDVWATMEPVGAIASFPDASPAGAIVFTDPRNRSMGRRALIPASVQNQLRDARAADVETYHAHRVALGVPEGGKDYAFGDAYPHEADFDVLNGVSFTKGCYVGQEIVARMQNKTIVRKRVVKIESASPLSANSDVLLGEASVGRVGTVSGNSALAMLRLDRAVEAQEKSVPLTSGGVTVIPDEAAIASYVKSVASAPASKLST